MVIGILKERFQDEQRVALSPFGVEVLTQAGAQVIIEHEAGNNARFTDEQYQHAGGTIAYSPGEVVGRSNLVMKVMPPRREEWEQLQEGQTLLSFLHLGVAQQDFIQHLLDNKVTAIGLELLRASDGTYPILRLMSEISGQMAAQVGQRWLRSDQGGRGVMLGGLAGVAPACVVILGVGSAGFSAAQACLGLGAQVILLDNDLNRLRYAEQRFDKRVTTVVASPSNLRRGAEIADVFIGAISINDASAHQIVTEDMVKTMKPGAVIIDISINQGGCVATSRPTTILDPVFTKHNVIHYCVPNMPSLVARSATYALTNGILMYQDEILGLESHRANTMASLKCGMVTDNGVARHSILTDNYGIPVSKNDCCQ